MVALYKTLHTHGSVEGRKVGVESRRSVAARLLGKRRRAALRAGTLRYPPVRKLADCGWAVRSALFSLPIWR